ncbi:MAG: hypothetical protein GY744_10910 [Gammaproteobacteria bacterium]|nr:hypothetical protein [Gammaproteobacteria bacterium]
MKYRNFYLKASIPFVLLYWLSESVVHYLIFEELAFEIFPSDINELWMRCVISILLIAFSGFADYHTNILLKKESEKKRLHYEIMLGMNHLVRNLQNNFSIINSSESIKKEFGEDTIKLLNQSSKEVGDILAQLTELENLDPELIKKIASSNVRNT